MSKNTAFQKIMPTGTVIDVRAGRVLSTAGDVARQLCFIVDGHVHVSRDDRHVAVLGAGACVGTAALIPGARYTSTAVTTEPTRVLVLTLRELHSLLLAGTITKDEILAAARLPVPALDVTPAALRLAS